MANVFRLFLKNECNRLQFLSPDYCQKHLVYETLVTDGCGKYREKREGENND